MPSCNNRARLAMAISSPAIAAIYQTRQSRLLLGGLESWLLQDLLTADISHNGNEANRNGNRLAYPTQKYWHSFHRHLPPAVLENISCSNHEELIIGNCRKREHSILQVFLPLPPLYDPLYLCHSLRYYLPQQPLRNTSHSILTPDRAVISAGITMLPFAAWYGSARRSVANVCATPRWDAACASVGDGRERRERRV